MLQIRVTFNPMFLSPDALSGGSFCLLGDGSVSVSPLATSTIILASWLTSLGRFSPLGPLGIYALALKKRLCKVFF